MYLDMRRPRLASQVDNENLVPPNKQRRGRKGQCILKCRRKSRSDTQARVIFPTQLDKCEQNLKSLRLVSWFAILDSYVTFVTFFRWPTYTAVSIERIKSGRSSTSESAVAFLPHLIELNLTRQKCDVWTGPEWASEQASEQASERASD